MPKDITYKKCPACGVKAILIPVEAKPHSKVNCEVCGFECEKHELYPLPESKS